jgi:hypothetical protein
VRSGTPLLDPPEGPIKTGWLRARLFVRAGDMRAGDTPARQTSLQEPAAMPLTGLCCARGSARDQTSGTSQPDPMERCGKRAPLFSAAVSVVPQRATGPCERISCNKQRTKGSNREQQRSTDL